MVNFCKAILLGYRRCLPGLDLQPCVQKTLPFELYDHMGLQVTGEAGRRTKKECAALKQPDLKLKASSDLRGMFLLMLTID